MRIVNHEYIINLIFCHRYSLLECWFRWRFYLPGIIIDFNKVILYSSKKKIILDPKDFIITSKNGYNIGIQKNFTSFILIGENADEVISFNTKKKFSNIEKLSINMKFRRANISNKNNYQFLGCID